MVKKALLTFITAGFSLCCVCSWLYAGTSVEDVVKMENKAYTEHKKAIVSFSHKKHAEDYAAKHSDFFKNGCGECHHDDKNTPLKDLKTGDNVQNCIECHKTPGERPKGKGAPKLSKKERLAYHAEAIHYNCKDCHNKYNKKTNTKDTPTTCTKCHPKSK